jgi:uncharacterized protein YbaR (Trm112 family)
MDVSLLRWLLCPFCGGNLNVSEADQVAGELRYGVLTCYCGRYPVVAGIPVLKKDATDPFDEVITLIKAGRHREALLALLSPSSPALAPAWIRSLPSTTGTRWFKHLAHHRALRGWREQAATLLTDREGQITAWDVFDFYFRNKEIYN